MKYARKSYRLLEFAFDFQSFSWFFLSYLLTNPFNKCTNERKIKVWKTFADCTFNWNEMELYLLLLDFMTHEANITRFVYDYKWNRIFECECKNFHFIFCSYLFSWLSLRACNKLQKWLHCIVKKSVVCIK